MPTWDLLIADTGLDLMWFFTLCGVSFVASFIAAALGLGGGILVLATMALALPPVVLIPIHGFVQVGSNLGRAVMLYRSVLYSIVPAFVVGAIIGITVGTHFLVSLPTRLLQFILVIFILYATWAPKFQATHIRARTFFGVGAISAFTSMFVGAAGPILAPFVAVAGKDRRQVVATQAVLMLVQHAFKIISFGLIGFAFGPYIPLLAGMIGFGFAGTYAGGHVLHRLPEKTFRLGLKIILTLLALKLLYSALFP